MANSEDRVAIVTGANSGIGFHATKTLAEKGIEVVMACRDHDKATDARKNIEEDLRDPDIRIIELDLSDLSSINDFARRFKENYDRLDLMVNNAGVMHIPFNRTNFGFEYQFGVNHLGHFYLNSQLIDLIKETEDSRIITVSSLLHKKGELDFDKLNDEENYDKKRAYGDSKLANLLYAKELDKRFKENEIDSKSIAVHPGYSDTQLQKKSFIESGNKIGLLVGKAMNFTLAQSAESGSQPTVHACLEDLEGGEFIGPDGFKEMRGNPTQVEPDERADNDELRTELWDYSEDELGISFNL